MQKCGECIISYENERCNKKLKKKIYINNDNKIKKINK